MGAMDSKIKCNEVINKIPLIFIINGKEMNKIYLEKGEDEFYINSIDIETYKINNKIHTRKDKSDIFLIDPIPEDATEIRMEIISFFAQSHSYFLGWGFNNNKTIAEICKSYAQLGIELLLDNNCENLHFWEYCIPRIKLKRINAIIPKYIIAGNLDYRIMKFKIDEEKISWEGNNTIFLEDIISIKYNDESGLVIQTIKGIKRMPYNKFDAEKYKEQIEMHLGKIYLVKKQNELKF